MLSLARFELSAIFRREDVVALQVFRGVNVLGLLLRSFLASAFLTGGFGNALIFLILSLVLSLVLGAALNCTKENEGRNQKRVHTTAGRAEGGLYGSQTADPGWSVKIRAGHSNRPLTGDNAWRRVYPKRPFLDTTAFFGPPPGTQPCVPGRCELASRRVKEGERFSLANEPRIPRRTAEPAFFFGDEGLRVVI